MKRRLTILAVLSFFIPLSYAHFPILIHDAPFATLNETVNLMFAVGHPYEQEYAESGKPEKIVAILPDGKTADLTNELKEGKYSVDDLVADIWEFTYKPTQPGDTIVALDSEPVFGLNNTLEQEYLKICVHAEDQGGWDQRTGQPIEIVPLTRPYGLEEGFVFTGRLMKGDQGLAGVDVEIEQFLTHIPALADLPPEPLITKVVKTDPNGVFSYTLPHTGWWILAAHVEEAGQIQKGGKTYTLSGLAALWVHVEPVFEQKFPSAAKTWKVQK